MGENIGLSGTYGPQIPTFKSGITGYGNVLGVDQKLWDGLSPSDKFSVAESYDNLGSMDKIGMVTENAGLGNIQNGLNTVKSGLGNIRGGDLISFGSELFKGIGANQNYKLQKKLANKQLEAMNMNKDAFVNDTSTQLGVRASLAQGLGADTSVYDDMQKSIDKYKGKSV